MGEHLYTYADPPSERDVQRAVRVLENGGVLAYPTDCNWAFGCDAASSHGLARIRRLKPSHPRERPFTLLCDSISMVSDIAVVDSSAYRFLKKAWPGPYTVLLPSARSLPKQIKDKRRVVGVRVPESPLIQAVIARLGRPLASTSVPDVTGLPAEEVPTRPPRIGYEVFETFGHAIDLLLDLGEEVSGQESTIIDFTEGFPQLVRLGVGDPKLFDLDDSGL